MFLKHEVAAERKTIRVRVRVSSLVFVERNVGGRKLNILVI